MSELEEILDAFGKKLVTDVRVSWDNERSKKAAKYGSPVNPNSRLNASMDYETGIDDDTLYMSFTMSEHYVFPNKGRATGGVSEEGQKSLAEWIKRYGILKPLVKKQKAKIRIAKKKGKSLKTYTLEQRIKSAVYVISRKIKNKGFDGTGFYDKIINDGRVEALRIAVSEQMKKDITIILQTN